MWDKKEAQEKFAKLTNYYASQPIQHISLKQEKLLYAERMERRKKMFAKAKKRLKQEPKTIFINSITKRVKLSDVSEDMIDREQDFIINE